MPTTEQDRESAETPAEGVMREFVTAIDEYLDRKALRREALRRLREMEESDPKRAA